MSQKAVAEFLRRVARDAQLRDRLNAAAAEDAAPAVVAIAAELGFDFAVEELHQATEAIRNRGEAELSDDDLAQVAGGFLASEGAARTHPAALSGLSFVPEQLSRRASWG
jgi:predicted ribosomally synthesized peptide with nif11-like leader